MSSVPPPRHIVGADPLINNREFNNYLARKAWSESGAPSQTASSSDTAPRGYGGGGGSGGVGLFHFVFDRFFLTIGGLLSMALNPGMFYLSDKVLNADIGILAPVIAILGILLGLLFAISAIYTLSNIYIPSVFAGYVAVAAGGTVYVLADYHLLGRKQEWFVLLITFLLLYAAYSFLMRRILEKTIAWKLDKPIQFILGVPWAAINLALWAALLSHVLYHFQLVPQDWGLRYMRMLYEYI